MFVERILAVRKAGKRADPLAEDIFAAFDDWL
jgi:hypothetical protein